MLETEGVAGVETGRRRSTFYVSLTDSECSNTPPEKECRNPPSISQRRNKTRALVSLFRSPDYRNVSDSSECELHQSDVDINSPNDLSQKNSKMTHDKRVRKALCLFENHKRQSKLSTSFDSADKLSKIKTERGSCGSLNKRLSINTPELPSNSTKCVTLPNNLSARMCLEVGRDRKGPREIALSPLDPPKVRLTSLIRRTHSTKLSRSPSLLKALASKCVDQSTSPIAIQNQEDEDQGVLSDTSYEKACRRGSAPSTPVLGARNGSTSNDVTPSRIVNFFSKRSFRSNPLKRTKSVTKLERARRPVPELDGGRLRTSRSHESLLSGHSVMSTLELGSGPGSVEIKALHPSVLGRQHCFQVTLSSDQGNPRYFSCRSQDERDKWVHSLRKSVQPDVEHTRRTDHSLKLWILEAKAIPNKKRYFCELYLDDVLYAVTSIKLKNELCFWGEHYDFNGLPPVNFINIRLFREAERKKRKNSYIGQVKIPVADITSRYLIEKWFPIEMDKPNGKDSPSLRIKCRFQSIDILPVKVYSEFLDYLKRDYKKVCEILEPVIGIKAKEDIATSLVLAMQSEGMAKQFLADIVMMDIVRVNDQKLTFRGNSLATKAMEAYLKLTGDKYLQETLGDLVADVLTSQLDCEVDPLKVVSVGSLEKQQHNLRITVQKAWNQILDSHINFPPELRECFALFRERLIQLNREDISDNLISASIFLRFLCPAILSPSLFNITHEYPNEKAARNLTLIAKTLQTLANFTRFQGKENFMEFMNDFLEREAGNMKEFVRNISTRVTDKELRKISRRDSCPATQYEFDGYIDLGKQLSILSTLLKECLSKVAPNKLEELKPLENVLDSLHKSYCKQYLRTSSSPPDVHCSENIFTFNDPTVNKREQVESSTPTTPQVEVTNEINGGSLELRKTAPPVPSPRHPHVNTLPRNIFGNPLSAIHNQNNLQDFLIEPANAFVSKSPTPKNVGRKVQHGSYPGDRRRIGNEHDENISPNLDEISDLFHYVDEAEDPPNNKGSNMSISQLSNVASSGYQSFAYSQSSSPVELTMNNNVQNGVPRYEGLRCHYDVRNRAVKKGSSFDGKYYASQNGTRPYPSINTNRSQALAFANPVYSMEYTQKQQLDTSSSDDNLEQSEVKQIIQVENASHHCQPPPTPDHRYNNYLDSDSSCPVQLRPKITQPRTNPKLAYRSSNTTNNNLFDGRYTKPQFDKQVYDDRFDSSIKQSNITREKNLRRLSLESGRDLSDSSSDTEEPLHYHTTGRYRKTNAHRDVEHYEREIERLQTSVDLLRHKIEKFELGDSSHDITQPEGENKMRAIIARLIAVEEELRQEQRKIYMALSHKQRVIEAQEHRIAALDATNNRLLNALSKLKERYISNGSNSNLHGPVSPGDPNDNALLSDLIDMKTSTC